MGKRIPINFYTSVAAGSKKTVKSEKIPFKFKVTLIEVRHDINDQQKTKVGIFSSHSDDTPTTKPPLGTNLIKQYSQEEWIRGNGEIRKFVLDHKVREEDSYLKMYLDNTDTFEHQAWARVQIERLEET